MQLRTRFPSGNWHRFSSVIGVLVVSETAEATVPMAFTPATRRLGRRYRAESLSTDRAAYPRGKGEIELCRILRNALPFHPRPHRVADALPARVIRCGVVASSTGTSWNLELRRQSDRHAQGVQNGTPSPGLFHNLAKVFREIGIGVCRDLD